MASAWARSPRPEANMPTSVRKRASAASSTKAVSDETAWDWGAKALSGGVRAISIKHSGAGLVPVVHGLVVVAIRTHHLTGKCNTTHDPIHPLPRPRAPASAGTRPPAGRVPDYLETGRSAASTCGWLPRSGRIAADTVPGRPDSACASDHKWPGS